MIRTVSVCPYCRTPSAGVDDDVPTLVLAPDRADARPCPHLALVIVFLMGYRRQSGGLEDGRSGHWLWVRGEGPRELPMSPTDPLIEYVYKLVGGTCARRFRPRTTYRVDGAESEVREAIRPGSGDFPLRTTGGPALAALLDAFGVYSRTPDTLVAEVRSRAGRWAAATDYNAKTSFGDDHD
jgi:hypothetical protein